MKRLSISLVLAAATVFSGYSALGQILTPQSNLKVIATVVAHAHHGTLSNFISATDKM